MSGLLDPVQLAAARQTLTMNLHSTCTIQAVSGTAGVQTWAAPGVTVKCMKGNPGRGGGAEAMYAGDVPMSRFWVPVGTVVASGYRLIFEGTSYKVEELPSIHASEILRPVDCVEVRAPGEAV